MCDIICAMNTAKKKMGRPPIANPANKILPNIRVTPDKLNEYRQAAESAGLKFAAWARRALDKAVQAARRGYGGQASTAYCYESELAKWRGLAGTVFLCFGDIESVTFRGLPGIPCNTASQLSFSQRVDLIVEVLEGQQNCPKPSVDLVEKLKCAKELAERRDVLARSPLVTTPHKRRGTKDKVVEWFIQDERNDADRFDLAALKEFAGDVEETASELIMAASKYQGSYAGSSARER